MARSLSCDVLSHSIDLTHLITDNYGSSWNRCQLIGLSKRDGLVYLIASKGGWTANRQIAIFRGSALLSNSWKLISSFEVRTLERIDGMCVAFSNDCSQIGMVIVPTVLDENFTNIGHQQAFVLFDIDSSHWQQRLFYWKGARANEFDFCHTCVGWILYNNGHLIYGAILYLLSLNPAKDCIEYLCRRFPQVLVEEYKRSCPTIVSNDAIYCFQSNSCVEKYLYVCRLASEGFPWERYMIDGGDNMLFTNLSCFPKKFINDVPLFRGYLRETLKSLCRIYTVELDSAENSCLLRKIGQFHDTASMVSVDVVDSNSFLTASKRVALLNIRNTSNDRDVLILETVFFKIPTLKELCSLAVVKELCQKSTDLAKTRNTHSPTMLSVTWSGGGGISMEEVKKKLRLNSSTLRFGELKA